jgi:hypothetical protein
MKGGQAEDCGISCCCTVIETLATIRNAWKKETPYPGEDDWVSSSLRKEGKNLERDLSPHVLYLRPTAIKVLIIQ